MLVATGKRQIPWNSNVHQFFFSKNFQNCRKKPLMKLCYKFKEQKFSFKYQFKHTFGSKICLVNHLAWSMFVLIFSAQNKVNHFLVLSNIFDSNTNFNNIFLSNNHLSSIFARKSITRKKNFWLENFSVTSPHGPLRRNWLLR